MDRGQSGSGDVCLQRAQRGPGWPDEGISYDEAKEVCAYLDEDGTKVLNEKVNVIYYWTDTAASEGRAYIIVYNGGVFSRNIGNSLDYLSFRAVKDCAD